MPEAKSISSWGVGANSVTRSQLSCLGFHTFEVCRTLHGHAVRIALTGHCALRCTTSQKILYDSTLKENEGRVSQLNCAWQPLILRGLLSRGIDFRAKSWLAVLCATSVVAAWQKGSRAGRCKATCKSGCKLPWREAGPPDHLDD